MRGGGKQRRDGPATHISITAKNAKYTEKRGMGEERQRQPGQTIQTQMPAHPKQVFPPQPPQGALLGGRRHGAGDIAAHLGSVHATGAAGEDKGAGGVSWCWNCRVQSGLEEAMLGGCVGQGCEATPARGAAAAARRPIAQPTKTAMLLRRPGTCVARATRICGSSVQAASLCTQLEHPAPAAMFLRLLRCMDRSPNTRAENVGKSGAHRQRCVRCWRRRGSCGSLTAAGPAQHLPCCVLSARAEGHAAACHGRQSGPGVCGVAAPTFC